MSGSVNRVILIGRLGRDPELKYTQSGSAICSFSVATDDSYTDKQGEKHESTEWHNITIFGKLAEIANTYLKKGSQVYLEGKIKTEEYTDKENIKRKAVKIIVDQMQMLGSKPDSNGEQSERPTQRQSAPSSYGAKPKPASKPEQTGELIDDLPF